MHSPFLLPPRLQRAHNHLPLLLCALISLPSPLRRALGCILYELTSLRHAFDAQNINGLASKVIGGVYTPIGATYSRDLRDLIKAMLLSLIHI